MQIVYNEACWWEQQLLEQRITCSCICCGGYACTPGTPQAVGLQHSSVALAQSWQQVCAPDYLVLIIHRTSSFLNTDVQPLDSTICCLPACQSACLLTHLPISHPSITPQNVKLRAANADRQPLDSNIGCLPACLLAHLPVFSHP